LFIISEFWSGFNEGFGDTSFAVLGRSGEVVPRNELDAGRLEEEFPKPRELELLFFIIYKFSLAIDDGSLPRYCEFYYFSVFLA
jgi:hypothetical protein